MAYGDSANFVSMNDNGFAGGYQTLRSVVAATKTDQNTGRPLSTEPLYLKLTGNGLGSYSGYYSTDGGSTYTQVGTTVTNTLGGATMADVGVWYGTFSSKQAGTATFSNFSLTTTAVPEPASIFLALAGFGLLGLGRRRKQVV